MNDKAKPVPLESVPAGRRATLLANSFDTALLVYLDTFDLVQPSVLYFESNSRRLQRNGVEA